MTSDGINCCVVLIFNRIFVNVISLVQKLLQTCVAYRTFARILSKSCWLYIRNFFLNCNCKCSQFPKKTWNVLCAQHNKKCEWKVFAVVTICDFCHSEIYAQQMAREHQWIYSVRRCSYAAETVGNTMCLCVYLHARVSDVRDYTEWPQTCSVVKQTNRYLAKIIAALCRNQVFRTEVALLTASGIHVVKLHKINDLCAKKYLAFGFFIWYPFVAAFLACFSCAAWNADAVERWESCLSVSPSVCQTRGLWQNGRKICPDFFIPYERSFSLVFREEDWLVRPTPSTGNFGSTGPCWSEIADFEPIFDRGAWAVTPSQKSSINTNRKSTTCFPMSLSWPSYVVSKPPQTVAQKRKVFKIWTINCDNSETVRDRMSVTVNH